MNKIESLNHTKWDCKYHFVFKPKGRRKVLYGQLRVHLGEVFRGLVQHKESRIEEGHLMADHVHMMITIPPKYAISNVVGCILWEERDTPSPGVRGAKEELYGAKFLGTGCFVSTVGRDEEVIRNYIHSQEREDERLEQLGVWR